MQLGFVLTKAHLLSDACRQRHDWPHKTSRSSTASRVNRGEHGSVSRTNGRFPVYYTSFSTGRREAVGDFAAITAVTILA